MALPIVEQPVYSQFSSYPSVSGSISRVFPLLSEDSDQAVRMVAASRLGVSSSPGSFVEESPLKRRVIESVPPTKSIGSKRNAQTEITSETEEQPSIKKTRSASSIIKGSPIPLKGYSSRAMISFKRPEAQELESEDEKELAEEAPKSADSEDIDDLLGCREDIDAVESLCSLKTPRLPKVNSIEIAVERQDLRRLVILRNAHKIGFKPPLQATLEVISEAIGAAAGFDLQSKG